MTVELKQREDALRDAQGQLVQSEKMAAFGQLGAGIAHEVKNPLAGILGCTQLSLRKVEQGTPLERNLRLIEKDTRRCKEIIENLLRFARQENQREPHYPMPDDPQILPAMLKDPRVICPIIASGAQGRYPTHPVWVGIPQWIPGLVVAGTPRRW